MNITTIKESHPATFNTWISNLKPLPTTARKLVLAQRESYIKALGYSIDQVNDMIENFNEPLKNVVAEQRISWTAQDGKGIPLDSIVIDHDMKPDPNTYYHIIQEDQLKGRLYGQTNIHQQPQAITKGEDLPEMIPFPKEQIPVDQMLRTKFTGGEDLMNERNSKIKEQAQKNFDKSKTEDKTKEFKWNPSEVNERFNMNQYERPPNSLAEKFGPSKEETQLYLPTEQDLQQNPDNTLMPKKIRSGAALNLNQDSPAQPIRENPKNMAFRGRAETKAARQQRERFEKNRLDS